MMTSRSHLALFTLIAATAVAAPASAQQFWDSCAADQSYIYPAPDFYRTASPDASYADRPGCPLWVTDVYPNGRAAWFSMDYLGYPNVIQESCPQQRLEWTLARWLHSTLFEVVKSGVLEGVWNFETQSCVLVAQPGSGMTYVPPSWSRYRFLFRNLSHGVPIITSQRFVIMHH